jgi:hypothetical protein
MWVTSIPTMVAVAKMEDFEAHYWADDTFDEPI